MAEETGSNTASPEKLTGRETSQEQTKAREQTNATPADAIPGKEKKRRFVVAILAIIAVALIAVFSRCAIHGIQKLRQNPDFSWKSRSMVALYITAAASVLVVAAIVVQTKYRRKRGSKKRLAYWVCLLMFALIGFWTWTTITTWMETEGTDFSWESSEVTALLFASGIGGLLIVAFVLLLSRANTRWEVEDRLAREKGEDCLVVFNWTKKILHTPTIVAAFLAAFAVWACGDSSGQPKGTNVAEIVGAAWFCVWLTCHIIEDYDFSLTTVIALLASVLLITVLVKFGGAWPTIRSVLTMISIHASPALYIGFGLTYLASIALSYLKGVFYYVAIEPNQITVQHRIGEDAETYQKAHYDVVVETAVDVFEWFFYDTGTIRIAFQGGKRPPIECYVGRIRKKAPKLANILGVTSIEPDAT